MNLQLPDILIIVAYLVTMVMIGWLLRKKARLNKENYLLGGKSLPWYMLGLSDASDMFDISGTMWMVSLCFVYGMKSIWIPWLWPVFNQVFMMMYLSRWMRRSNATTGAEWLTGRFGASGRGVRSSHNIVVAFALLSCLGFMAYGFVGLGKFVQVFIPWDIVRPYIPFNVSPEYVPHFYGIIFTLFAMFYSILGGMHSIVLGDVIKYGLMTVGCISIAIIAMIRLRGHHLNVPEGWLNPFFGVRLDLDWRNIVNDADKKIQADGFSLFSVFFMMMLFKGIFASLAGPAPNYDMQKVLSTRSPQDASKMSGFVSIILLPIRYSMIIGLTVLALLYYPRISDSLQAGHGTDFERILPATINNFLPVGLMGIVLTGLLGAFMGTFSGTLNAAQAYMVNDIYLKYINPQASTRRTISMNYLAGLVVVITGVILGLFVKDVNTVLQWIVSGLYGGYVAANMLKWHWWRFNASGFFWGMMAGIIPAIALAVLKSFGWLKGLDLYYWPILFLLSLAGSVLGSYATPPTEEAVLMSFYKTVRPWGFWKPVHQKVIKADPAFIGNRNFRLNAFNILLGIIGQLCLTILPMYIVLWLKGPLLVTLVLLLIICLILKKTWWDKLNEY
ncbi:sodium:solute symporter family protein [Flavitalea sp. BT771]|uniref:sodium:solute symporter family protein n=1 Tax=Flavitalea sp. BT771 TaxID=3063329 RepID=UPI0026E1566A|nr:sodium:solute symporter family protein [Flavitalea sp. BT771]MDO6433723.1 sodium:solute symporter family protein [Flavitalea sp. BT771]MDV6222372.1 sodium:solute symporter family protein [Flavitalea sp. BT771]